MQVVSAQVDLVSSLDLADWQKSPNEAVIDVSLCFSKDVIAALMTGPSRRMVTRVRPFTATLRISVLFLLIAQLLHPAAASVFTWVGCNGYWTDATQWREGGLP